MAEGQDCAVEMETDVAVVAAIVVAFLANGITGGCEYEMDMTPPRVPQPCVRGRVSGPDVEVVGYEAVCCGGVSDKNIPAT